MMSVIDWLIVGILSDCLHPNRRRLVVVVVVEIRDQQNYSLSRLTTRLHPSIMRDI